MIIHQALHSKSTDGFTAVELLITLFIAAVFIMTGYQLYSVIMNDGSTAKYQAKSANIAYEYLMNAEATVAASCTPGTSTPAVPANSGVPAIEIAVNTTCPYGNGNQVSRLEVIVKYGSATPKLEVRSVVYAAQ